MDHLLRFNVFEVRRNLSAATGSSPTDTDLTRLFISMGLRPYGEGWWRASEAAAGYFIDQEIIERRVFDPKRAGGPDAAT